MLKENLESYRSRSKNRYVHGDSKIAFPDDYVCLDLETTGLRHERDSITEVCIYLVKDRKVSDKIVTLIHPPVKISPFITKLTGITNQMVSNAPEISEVLPDVRDMVSYYDIIGHCVSFDVKFLNYNLFMNEMDELRGDIIDTRRLCKQMVKGLPNYKLSTVAEYFHVNSPKHRAEADVQSAMGCFEEMRELWEKHHNPE